MRCIRVCLVLKLNIKDWVMKCLCAVLCVFSCLSSWAAVEVDQQVVDAIKSSNYTNALHVLNEKIEQKEGELQYLYQARGTKHFHLNEFDKARADYIKALPCSIKGDVEWLLGKTYEKLKEPKKAIFYLDKSIELAEGDELQIGFARYYKGRALASMGKFSEAKEVLLKIESNETTKNIMSEVQVMINFCAEKEQQLSEISPVK